MTAVYIHADNIVSPLGFTADENFRQLVRSVSGIKQRPGGTISPEPFQASLFDDIPQAGEQYTRFQCLHFGYTCLAHRHAPDPIGPIRSRGGGRS